MGHPPAPEKKSKAWRPSISGRTVCGSLDAIVMAVLLPLLEETMRSLT